MKGFAALTLATVNCIICIIAPSANPSSLATARGGLNITSTASKNSTVCNTPKGYRKVSNKKIRAMFAEGSKRLVLIDPPIITNTAEKFHPDGRYWVSGGLVTQSGTYYIKRSILTIKMGEKFFKSLILEKNNHRKDDVEFYYMRCGTKYINKFRLDPLT